MHESDLLERAFALVTLRRFRQAADVLCDALAIDPENATAHSWLGWCLAQENGDLDAAEWNARRGIELAPDDSFSYCSLSTVLKARKQVAPALAAIDHALTIDAAKPGYHALRSQILLMQRRLRDALQASEAGLALDADNEICLAIKSASHLLLGDHATAMKVANSLVSLNPESAAGFEARGWLLLLKNDINQAVGAFREALRLDPNRKHSRKGLLLTLGQSDVIFRKFFQLNRFLTNGYQVPAWIHIASLWTVIAFFHFGFSPPEPSLRPVIGWMSLAFLGAGWLVWAAWPLSLWSLRMNPATRNLLNREERRISGLAAATGLICIVSAVGAGVAARTWWWAVLTGAMGLLASTCVLIPFAFHTRARRMCAILAASVVLVACLWVFVKLVGQFWGMQLPLAVLAYTRHCFLANTCMMVICIAGQFLAQKK